MADGDYMPNHMGWGGWISLGLHACAFLSAAVWAWMSGLFLSDDKEPPPVFELLPFSETPKPEKAPAETPIKDLEVNPIKDLAPLDSPEPEPEVEPLPPQKPEPKETPKPAAKPKVSESDKARPQKMTRADFIKKFGKPKDSKPKPRPSKPVKISGIKVSESSFRVSTSINAAAASGATQNELQAYYAAIYRILKDNWVMPEDCAGMSLKVKLSLDISAYGKCSNARVRNSSGMKSFDESATRLFNSVTLPPPPRGKPITGLVIEFNSDIAS